MLLEDIQADVSSQLDDQSALGVQITRKNEVPEQGPTNRGVWFQVPGVTAVFADLKRSTELTAETRPKTSAFAYTHFVRAMAVILERFSAGYIDIQGDAVFWTLQRRFRVSSSRSCGHNEIAGGNRGRLAIW